MGYVVVQNNVQCSATLINFGPSKVDVRLKKSEKKGDLTKLGIFVEFNDRRNLLVGESTFLQVTCHPKQERYKERFTNVQHVIYVEVCWRLLQIFCKKKPNTPVTTRGRP